MKTIPLDEDTSILAELEFGRFQHVASYTYRIAVFYNMSRTFVPWMPSERVWHLALKRTRWKLAAGFAQLSVDMKW